MKNLLMICLTLSVGCLLMTVPTIVSAQIWEEWVTPYNGPNNTNDYANDMTMDANGNIYVTSQINCSTAPPWISDCATMKYNSAGELLWVEVFIGFENGTDWGSAIAVDDNGNVYVTGGCDSYPGLDGKCFTVKYDSLGIQQWLVTYDDAGNLTDKGTDIALDDVGNVYITGTTSGASTSQDYLTIKYNPQGIEQWINTYDGPANYIDDAYGIAIDVNNNVYVTGISHGTQTYDSGKDIATVMYNSDGVEQWSARYNGPGDDLDEGWDLVVDALGNAYVTGGSYGIDTDVDIVTIKYDNAGVEQWANRYAGATNPLDYGQAISMDVFGNVLVTGFINAVNLWGDLGDWVTIKYTSGGIEQWATEYNGNEDLSDTPWSITSDEVGNVYVTGSADYNLQYTEANCATIMYNSAGIEQWIALYSGSGEGTNGAYKVILDEEENVYIAGWSSELNNGKDAFVIKYSQTPALRITLEPQNPPIQIPASGGSFDFDVVLENSTGTTVPFDIWLNITTPNGYTFTTLGPAAFNLSGNTNISRTRSQNVPNYAAPGTYTMSGMVGEYPWIGYNQDSFTFEKLATGTDGIIVGDWLNTGEDFLSDGLTTELLPLSFCLFPCHPNPFNPTTVISFSLPVAGLVSLDVFDIGGKRVGVGLAPTRQYPPGTHNILFDGSGLPSGIYFARMTAGDFTQTQKLVLLK
ncbi:hypothetical protein CEE37_05260 [candidate division LCP-89 bacterium B3_LCP]|uniref:Secretion system C-terminal sorting domain-containing protein n=1 Tax=candidate division LCP-89 bacterium B3_LCP TaxID=2012998 RepID=A0A532V1I5_UNCL8|nr:MAG: hypothetical protein CEE37_05260 [candidate division LCP-89 bacterium B3_LCP]